MVALGGGRFLMSEVPMYREPATFGEKSRWTLEVDLTVTRKVEIRLPGKGNSNSHGARPVY